MLSTTVEDATCISNVEQSHRYAHAGQAGAEQTPPRCDYLAEQQQYRDFTCRSTARSDKHEQQPYEHHDVFKRRHASFW